MAQTLSKFIDQSYTFCFGKQDAVGPILIKADFYCTVTSQLVFGMLDLVLHIQLPTLPPGPGYDRNFRFAWT